MDSATNATAEARAIESILEILRERTGADFRSYRPATVRRRILNRMISVGAPSMDAYVEVLRSGPREAEELLRRIAIKVSRFYRNPESFEIIRTRVLAELAAAARAEPLRIWSAGCGCGEEPYTFALLLEAAGIPGTVHATDLDPGALDVAEAGVYDEEAVADLPAGLGGALVPIYARAKRRMAVPASVRQRVRFERHDLLCGRLPSDQRYDLVSCRNVLIYLDSTVREHVFRLLCGALRSGGYLFLGEAEWPAEPVAASLQTFDRSARLFRANLR